MNLRRYTRRQALARAGTTTAIVVTLPNGLLPAATPAPSPERTLRAAVARIVPALQPGDWSAADVGADQYILGLLAGTDRVYAGGPVRARFSIFQSLSRVKQLGWSREIARLRALYRAGLAELDRLAGGDFAAAPPELQDAILTTLDDRADAFFGELYNHTMEGVYAHPAYGGNRDYRAWQTFGYAGDVHGVRFPGIGPAGAPWNVYGGYAPEEMERPG